MFAKQWNDEIEAAQLVSSYLGGHYEKVDSGGGACQRHDFDIHLSDNCVVALEVTRYNHSNHVQTSAELNKRSWSFSELRYHWSVSLSPKANVKRLYAALPHLLRRAEEAGVIRGIVQPPHDEQLVRASPDRVCSQLPSGSELAHSLRELEVHSIARLDPASGDEGDVGFNPAYPGGAIGPAVLVNLVNQVASEPDNRKKLAKADEHYQRHLFIWVEISQMEAVATMDSQPRDLTLPPGLPDLPDEVDVVWLATAFTPRRVWTFDRHDGWKDRGHL